MSADSPRRQLAAVEVGTVDEALDALMSECPRGHDREGHRIGFYWHGTALGGPLGCLSDLPFGYPGVVPTWSTLRLMVARRRRQDEQAAAGGSGPVDTREVCLQCGQGWAAPACGPTHAMIYAERQRPVNDVEIDEIKRRHPDAVAKPDQ